GKRTARAKDSSIITSHSYIGIWVFLGGLSMVPITPKDMKSHD
ncbi:MAG: hypothetical protein ACI8TQ_004109, partial [Planctomycetota bacterium]